tara:strand:+ start:104 stop:529 length:426 start_codon:yes stop_codon:yes gene_type:complete
MFNFTKKNKNLDNKKTSLLSKTASLLIHAAKMDESYTEKEKEIIKKTLIDLGVNSEEINKIMTEAEENEKNSNQILDFTKDLKKTDQDFKIKLVESLWKIIYSDAKSDMFEDNLMRRLTGLLYFDKKMVGDIKEKIKKNLL